MTIEEMLAKNMQPEEVWDALEARPIPSPLDMLDFCACISAIIVCHKDMAAGIETKEKREAMMRATVGAVSFGLYVGKLSERLSRTPAIGAMLKLVGGRDGAKS